MSRNRTPTVLLEGRGAFEHDPQRSRDNEPIPSGPLGDPPARFNDVQRAVWIEVSEQAAEGVLTVCDRMLVEIYCTLVARHRGGVVDAEGETQPPEILKASEYNLIISILSRMGFTPADRSKLNVPSKEKEKAANTFEELANTGRGRDPAKPQ
jgi:phage terminase small subunit